jgi:HSP20 family protein
VPGSSGFPSPDLRYRLDQLFEELIYRRWGIPAPDEWRPALDVYETRDAYLVKVDLPGVPPERVEIRVTETELNVSGTRTREEPEGALSGHCERPSGRFRRSVCLAQPVAPEEARAECRHGTYSIWLFKRRPAGALEQTFAAAEPAAGRLIRTTVR